MKIGFFGGKFLPFHMGHASVIIKASTICDKLYVILSYSKKRDYDLCANSGNIKYISYKVRLSWLRQFTKDMDNIEVFAIEDDAENDDEYDWKYGAKQIRQIIGEKIDFVFSSENSYEEIFKELYPEAKHIVIDNDRNSYPISATKIRHEGPFKNWDFLPEVVKSFFIKKVVIVGTESCGKSTLVKNLAKLYNTNYVEEYGRTICEEKGGSELLLNEDYPFIAYKQKVLEKEALNMANKILFIDTESIVTKYYLQLYENLEDDLYEKISNYQDYDLWIYLEPDVDWIDDGTRKHGQQKIREENNKLLKQMLNKNNIDYVSISGNYLDRLTSAVALVDKLLEVK